MKDFEEIFDFILKTSKFARLLKLDICQIQFSTFEDNKDPS